MNYIEHLLGICGEHWHPNILHITLTILIILIIKKIYEANNTLV
jgi:hypothetical protein